MRILFLLLLSPNLFGQNSTVLSGDFSNLSNDTIKCVLQLNNNFPRKTQTIKIPLQNGKFKRSLNINQPAYLYVTDGENYINGLIDPGDSVIIKFDTSNTDNRLTIEGKGKQKLEFLHLFLQAKIYRKLVSQIAIVKSQKFPFDYMFHYIDSVENWFIHQLDSIKIFMTDESYSLLLGDIKGSFLGNRNRSVGLVYHENAEETLKKRESELTPYSKSVLQSLLFFDNMFSYSQTYVNEINNILFTDYDYRIITNTASNDLLIKYQYFDSLLPKSLKAPVLTLLLEKDIKQLNQAEKIEFLIQRIYQMPQDSSYKNYILKVYRDAIGVSVFKKGSRAPDFIIENVNGEKINLDSFKGKVIYMDFWYAACGPCHVLFETTKPVKKYFSSDDVVFLNISVDKKDIWKKALDKYNIIGYNAFTENQTSNHSIIKAYKVNGYPTTCLIDKNGNIFNANPSNIADEVKKQIEDALKIE